MKVPDHKQITVTEEWSLLGKMNSVFFPGGSRLMVQLEQHGAVAGPPTEKQGTIYQNQKEKI